MLKGVVQQTVVGAGGQKKKKKNTFNDPHRDTAQSKSICLRKKRMSSECWEHDVLDVSIELLFAAAGPVVAMESRLNQRSHDAAHAGLISAAVALAVMLHA